MMDVEQITSLSDDELYAKLQEMGGPVGPIVTSTRSVYERQLYKILHGISLCELSQESAEEIEHNIPPQKSYIPNEDINSMDSFTPSSTSSPQTIFGSAVEFRHRPLKSYAEATDGIYFDRTSLARSSYRSDLRNITSNEAKFQYASKQNSAAVPLQQPKKPSLVLLAIFAFIIILCILVYMNMESSNVNPVH